MGHSEDQSVQVAGAPLDQVEAILWPQLCLYKWVHQGPVDAILDASHQPRGCHLMAQVVAGVSSQAEIAIDQGHKGQGLGLGAEAQQLWGQEDTVRGPGRT